jgi:uncharacterized RDD family membrane protein YckC
LERPAAVPLSLFPKRADRDDEPLIRLPAAPRPPLAVRKTPDAPRLRGTPKAAPRVESEPRLMFSDEAAPSLDLEVLDAPTAGSARPVRQPASHRDSKTSTAGPRLGAVAIDHLILASVDVAVLYFTLRVAALTLADWRLLPPAPLLTFLVLVKFAYFLAFTAIGGQTIGKMALNLRVVGAAGVDVDAACALRRTTAGLLSSIPFGLGFLPALLWSDRRALHDRVAQTRVIAQRSS